MTVTDLYDDALAWNSFSPAGADVPAEMVMLRSATDSNSRTVLVRFPAGWSRAKTGYQPAGEEMLVLSGALTMSGHTGTPGHLLVVEPKATRADTATTGETRALVWFSGAPGGWTEDVLDEAEAGSISVLPVGAELRREPSDALPGLVEVLEDAAGRTFENDVDLVWLATGQWAHVAAGDAAPEVSGEVVVRHWI
ncbi:hypothetical protein FE697_016055 [Mumia zhuanghuii]|uniref:Uncharacterized protein n=2 Tax=Mumia TaxID=1546255 RepID=A0ABW1QT42_9ACTN|nr:MULTISPECIES: hypothetical protein [Mumia]KAA1420476.1 hypothetical protein FE697_016055 [Mumia zhuanghuii]